MKTLAIDYGNKNIGLAISNKKGTIAFPFDIIKNNNQLLAQIKKISQEEKIKLIVVGIPKYNPKTALYYQIEKFVNDLKSKLDIRVDTYDELLTSKAVKSLGLKPPAPAVYSVRRHLPKQKSKHPAARSRPGGNRHDLAALILLQEYLLNNIS